MPFNPVFFVLAEARTDRLPLGLPAVHMDGLPRQCWSQLADIHAIVSSTDPEGILSGSYFSCLPCPQLSHLSDS